MSKFAPIVVATDWPLAASSTVVGDPVRLTAMERATIWITYTPADGNTNGRTILAIEAHRSASGSAPASNDVGWSRVPVLDGNSYSLGFVGADSLEVGFATLGTDDPVTRHYPGLDVSGVWWLRVLLRDDGTNRGTASVWITGSSS